MGRRLPWKTSETILDVGKSPKVKTESPRAPVSRSPSVPAAAHTPVAKKPRRERVVDPERIKSPSTSPPPEPPTERFMIPGPLEDDRYRMVEDEFLSIAHQFTTHLHRAEYNRLKALAKSQNARTIREIERPTVGLPTLLARQRQESTKRALKQRKLNDEDGDIPWRGTSLQGLMESPRKESKWLPSGVATTTTTRASAGFRPNLGSPSRRAQAPLQLSSGRKRQLPIRDDDETSDADDLATPSRSVSFKPRTTPTSSSTPRSTKWPVKTPRGPTSSEKSASKHSTSAPRLTSTVLKPTTYRLNEDDQDDDDNDDDDPFGITKRRIRRKQSKEQVRKAKKSEPSKKVAPDTIPSFI
ncbi:Fc.00g090470.m01.CDS01 [Cosmosporella sp. VM-42]